MAILTCLVGLHYGHIIVHYKVTNNNLKSMFSLTHQMLIFSHALYSPTFRTTEIGSFTGWLHHLVLLSLALHWTSVVSSLCTCISKFNIWNWVVVTLLAVYFILCFLLQGCILTRYSTRSVTCVSLLVLLVFSLLGFTYW